MISESVDRACNTQIKDIVLLGDFNCDASKPQNNRILNLMQQYNFDQLVTESTHFTENSSSLLDLILIRNKSNVFKAGALDTFIENQVRYHVPTAVIFKFSKNTQKPYKRHIWLYEKGNYDEYRHILNNIDWASITDDNDLDNVAEKFTETLIKAAEKTVQNKTVTIRRDDYPWINSKLIRNRKRLFRKARKSNNNIRLWQKFKTVRNKVIYEIRQSKQLYFENLASSINIDKPNPKLFWEVSKQLMKSGLSQEAIPPLRCNNQIFESDTDKANILNDYFASQSKVRYPDKPLPNSQRRIDINLSSIVITEQDVKDSLSTLKINKSSGPDFVSPRLLKEGASIIVKPLTKIFNKSLQSAHFPKPWKYANVTPIHKKEDKSLPSNYRPVSLLSQIGKSMEKCIHKHMFNYVNLHQLLTPLQSGFIPKDSTTNQLIHLYHTFCEAVDDGKEVSVVFCDISKAFDRVWHKGFLHKLENIGCTGKLLEWFKSYLCERKQRVVLKGQASNWTDVEAGVPQGSVLGPLLFLIFINDIVKDINSSIRLFADDTSLYKIVENPNAAALSLNTDLDKIYQWADVWLVEFNPLKTFTMTISILLAHPYHPPLFFNGVQIQETDTHKHLGLIFSSNCT